MSTFVAALYNYLRRLHYLGRNFSGAANVEVWFGGTRMSVSELLQIVAGQFDVSPKVLYDVLRDLDEIITAATDPHAQANIEVGGGGRRSNRSSAKDIQSPEVKATKRKKRIKTIEVESNDPTQTHVMQALGMLHHLTKTKSNIRERRSSSASCRLHSCKNPYQTVL
ncbi:unnamed protein product [Toxocara canis]|uniref:HTH OST-type domain-containing protein n=1 Tax=Toxocara canis TaxID=6265 RepID=A0A183UTA2_TOXCA|nr:unnamed protein product [Toxocara canis]